MSDHEQLVDDIIKSFWTLLAIAALIVPVVYAVSYVGGY